MARIEIESAGMAPNMTPSSEFYFELGLNNSTGRDGAPDLVAAHKWFNIAAMQGNPEAARFREEIAGELSPSEKAEALRLAREWIRLH